MPKYRTTIPSGIPKEFCQCGCGSLFTPSRRNHHAIFIKGHNSRVRRHHLSILERLEERSIKIPNGCWLWLGAWSGQRHYGDIYIKDRHCYTHRVSYEIFHGPITEGKEICHTCDVPRCWNPHHLFAGTHEENMQDCLCKNRFYAKLNTYLVMQIRFLAKHMTAIKIQHLLDCQVTVQSIQNVISYKTWRVVP
jgi:hypothetical protein